MEEMETDNRGEKLTDNDPIKQGIGKRVIGELVAPGSVPDGLCGGQKIRVLYLPVYW